MLNKFWNLNKTIQKQIIETLIFASEFPISLDELLDIIENKLDFSGLVEQASEITTIEINNVEEVIMNTIEEINSDLQNSNRPYKIIKVANGYTFATRNEFGKILGSLPKFRNKKRFSKAMLETLAIIAYKQPITKPEIEEIRGTNSSEVVNTLLERDLIKIVGRKDTVGRPFMYGTTIEFLKTFGISDLSELPNLEEIRTLIEIKNTREELTLKIDFEEENN
ncbi:MAG: SMC-Scp complex subunit ScpB [Ignavibacteria bacterium]|nr:SMC-Scp complex subunit ScpB [Ignavibacteria bacterium]